MNIIEGPTLRLRQVEIYDWEIFARCYADWPADAAGYYSISRAQDDCDVAVARNRLVTIPLTEDSSWQQTLLIMTDAYPNGMGLNRAKAEGTVVTVLNQAFIPECRGLGYMEELQQLLQVYAFTTVGATEARWAILPTAVAAIAHVNNRSKYSQRGEALGARDRTLTLGAIDKESWLKWVDENPQEDAINKGNVIVQQENVDAP